MTNRLSHRTCPESDYRDSPSRLVLIVMLHDLHGIRPRKLLADVHYIVFSPCLARSMERPHRKGLRLRIAQSSIEEVLLRRNLLDGNIGTAKILVRDAGQRDVGKVVVDLDDDCLLQTG